MLTADGTIFYEAADVEIASPTWPGLTPRERQVCEWICEGKERASIAVIIGIDPRTVDTHRGNAMTKLGVDNAVQLLRLAVKEGWVRL